MLLSDVKPDQVEIRFQDEARVGQQNTTTRLWALRGTRPRAVRQLAFLSVYFFAAVCPATQNHAAVILPNIGAHSMQIHLDEISQNVTSGKHAVLVMDRAGWHRAKSIKIPSNITVLFLPP